MKKVFTFKKSLLTAALVLLTSEGAFAFNDSYVPIHGSLLAYPTGAGKVYAKMDEDCTPVPGQNFDVPADKVDVKFVNKTAVATGWYWGYAEAADGWLFAGFAAEKYEDGEPTLPEQIDDDSNPAYLRVPSAVYTMNTLFDDESEALENVPDEPDLVHYALFTHVAPRIPGVMSKLGTVEIDKVVNYIGEEVTLTATVNEKYEDYNTNFSHWVERSTGKEIKENPLTITVTKLDEYEAVFTSDALREVEFPEAGGVIEWYNDCLAYYPEDVKQLLYSQGHLKQEGDRTYFEEVEYNNNIEGQTAGYLYGKGKQLFLEDKKETTPSGINFYGAPFEDWSGEEGAVVADLTQIIEEGSGLSAEEVVVGDISAYLFDPEKGYFCLVEDGFVPANRVFLAIPQVIFDEFETGFVPDVIYLTPEDDTTGIGGTEAKSPAKNVNTYTIDGRMVGKPGQKGIYIYDGKKLILRK